MQLGVSEILKRVADQPTRTMKIEELRRYKDNQVLMTLLKMSFDKNLKWRLPEGVPPYKPSPDFSQQGMLYKEAKRLYLFLDLPNSPNLTKVKRERLFLDLLESLHPDDAKLLLAVKDKKPLAKGITQKLVEEALPDLLQ